jgi:hypothetical protein
VFHQQTHNAAQANIGSLVLVCHGPALSVSRKGPRPRALARANYPSLADAKIMRESPPNDKPRSLRGLGKSHDRMPQSILALGRDMDGPRRRGQSQHNRCFP